MKANSFKQKAIILAVLAAAVLLIPTFVTGTLALQYIINIMIFAYFATSWNIIGGYAGQLALGNGVFVGIGAYVSAVLFSYEGVSPYVGMLVGGLVCAALAYVIGFLTFRLNGSYFALATVAMLHIIRLTFMSNKYMFGYKTNGALSFNIKWQGGIENLQFETNVGYFYMIFLLLVAGILISWYIKNSKMGYYLQAISTNPEAANSLGVNVMAMKLKANMISAFMMGVGGTFYTFFMSVIDPSKVLGYDMSVQILLFAIIGGSGTLVGPVLAAVLLVPLQDVLRGLVGASVQGLAPMVYGLILMIFVYFVPRGLWPTIVTAYDNFVFKRNKAKQMGGEGCE